MTYFYTHSYISRSIWFCAALVHFHPCMIFHMLSHRMLQRSVLSCLPSVDIWMISSLLLVRTMRGEHPCTYLVIHTCLSFFLGYIPRSGAAVDKSVLFFLLCWKTVHKEIGASVCVCVLQEYYISSCLCSLRMNGVRCFIFNPTLCPLGQVLLGYSKEI